MEKMCATCVNFNGQWCSHPVKFRYCYGDPRECGRYCKSWAPGTDWRKFFEEIDEYLRKEYDKGNIIKSDGQYPH